MKKSHFELFTHNRRHIMYTHMCAPLHARAHSKKNIAGREGRRPPADIPTSSAAGEPPRRWRTPPQRRRPKRLRPPPPAETKPRPPRTKLASPRLVPSGGEIGQSAANAAVGQSTPPEGNQPRRGQFSSIAPKDRSPRAIAPGALRATARAGLRGRSSPPPSPSWALRALWELAHTDHREGARACLPGRPQPDWPNMVLQVNLYLS